jgi:adenosylcobinamide-phosphate synthase
VSLLHGNLAILAVALLADRMIGDPQWLWSRIPHPVVAFGAAVSLAERLGNRTSDSDSVRQRNGMISLVLLLVLTIVFGVVLASTLDAFGLFGWIVEIALVAALLAQKSLADHVRDVAAALRRDGVAGGQIAVAKIVGRDPETLDAPGICRAAVESLAENFSDGVVAPALWYAVFGLPGLFAYKMLNTADSMIGHKTPRHLAFGRAAARADDLANWPAARLSAMFIAMAALVVWGRAAAGRALRCALSDAGLHRSPNAGWPECAMAGAIDLALAGERQYDGVVALEPMLNAAGRHPARPGDIDAALRIFDMACSAVMVTVLILYLLV